MLIESDYKFIFKNKTINRFFYRLFRVGNFRKWNVLKFQLSEHQSNNSNIDFFDEIIDIWGKKTNESALYLFKGKNNNNNENNNINNKNNFNNNYNKILIKETNLNFVNNITEKEKSNNNNIILINKNKVNFENKKKSRKNKNRDKIRNKNNNYCEKKTFNQKKMKYYF